MLYVFYCQLSGDTAAVVTRVPSRLGPDTTPTPAAAAAAAAAAATVPGLESTKGSAPGATSGSAAPK